MLKSQKGAKNKGFDEYKGKYIIPVMGPTGSGKSTFINLITGREAAKVGHSMSSCTEELQPVEVPEELIQRHVPLWDGASSKPAKSLIMVDTPGFDHSEYDDFEVLRRIADWLARTYGAKARLAGVIYLVDIKQGSVTDATKRNFDVFDKLCGREACKSVALGTVGWRSISREERPRAEGRERELRNNFWRDMIEKGSSLQRVDEDLSPPWHLVQWILYEGKSPVLQIQQELVELEKKLPQTQAALVLGKRSGGSNAEDVRALEQKIQTLKERLRQFRRLFG